jgi:hypothetical protein
MDTRKPIDTRKIKDPESYHKSFSYGDTETYQQAFNYGQAQINFLLNNVDYDFVEALQQMVKILKTIQALPQLARDLNAIDFSKIDAALSDAKAKSATVADIKPPGCLPPYPPGG